MHIKFQLIRLFYLFIWWCETTEGFIDSHFDVKVSNVFFRYYGLNYIHTHWMCASTVLHISDCLTGTDANKKIRCIYIPRRSGSGLFKVYFKFYKILFTCYLVLANLWLLNQGQ